MDKNNQHKETTEEDVIIVRYGELALKGDNRRYFESQLQRNMEKQLFMAAVDARVAKIRGRFFVHVPRIQAQKAVEVLTRVFGIVSVSPAKCVDATAGAVIDGTFCAVDRHLTSHARSTVPVTFRVSAKRINKSFPGTSMELAALLGKKLLERFPLKVKLTTPELVVGVEIYEQAYIFTETQQGLGGLPVGVSGRVAVQLDAPFSLLAVFLMEKRGCEAVLVSGCNIDASSLQRFTPQPIVVQALGQRALSEVVAQEGCYALVDALVELPKENKSKANNIVTLHPLIAWTKKQAQEACNRHSLACL